MTDYVEDPVTGKMVKKLRKDDESSLLPPPIQLQGASLDALFALLEKNDKSSLQQTSALHLKPNKDKSGYTRTVGNAQVEIKSGSNAISMHVDDGGMPNDQALLAALDIAQANAKAAGKSSKVIVITEPRDADAEAKVKQRMQQLLAASPGKYANVSLGDANKANNPLASNSMFAAPKRQEKEVVKTPPMTPFSRCP